ncbi:MAG: hypothetical protein EOP85_05565 [Verrucomicrobiaceae bacterium]|nr:MAG: hypothetical protein EOP85_05565 [Verrucomicrobiaceae bacterium]
MELTTLRDERLVDLKREIRVSTDLRNWTVLATSISGGPFTGQNGLQPAISHERVGDIASVGVIRRDRIRDTRPVSGEEKRFYQLTVTRITP